MITRRYAPITAFLAFALLCLLPTTLLARPRAHREARHAHAQSHTIKQIHSRRQASRHVTREVSHREARRHRSHIVAVSAPRRHHRGHLQQAALIEPPVALLPDAPTETHQTGVARPPDLDDADSAASQPTADNTPRRQSLPSVEEEAATPEILPALYNARGRLVVPPPLRGSREILIHQNEVAERDGLQRVQDDDDLEAMRRQRKLVSLPVSAGLQIDERLPFNRRYTRPWTAQFLEALARAHYAHFHTPLQVNSAVRTVAFQQRLMRTNGNAAPARGETASPHLTGQAVDLAKHGLSLTEIAWMRGYLLPLVQEGKIDVEEEFQQACFHISVYKRYLPPSSVPRRHIAARGETPTALAVALH